MVINAATKQKIIRQARPMFEEKLGFLACDEDLVKEIIDLVIEAARKAR